MPHNVDVWVDDRDDGNFTIYIDRDLITEQGAAALESILGSVVLGWKRLDDHLVLQTLRAVTG